MLAKISRYVFGSFVFASQISLGIALLYGVLILVMIPIVDGKFNLSFLLLIMGVVVAVCFFSSVFAFLAVIGLRKYWKAPDVKKEGYVVLGLAALVTNLWLIIPSFDENFWTLYVLNILVSAASITLGGRIYARTLSSLDKIHLEMNKSSADLP